MKKLLAMVLCVIMIVSVLSTAAYANSITDFVEAYADLVAAAEMKGALGAAYAKLATVQEFGVAKGIKKSFADLAASLDWRYADGTPWSALDQAAYATWLFDTYKDLLDAGYTKTGDTKKDLRSFVKASTKAYQAVGAIFMVHSTEVGINTLLNNIMESFKDEDASAADWALYDWIAALS